MYTIVPLVHKFPLVNFQSLFPNTKPMAAFDLFSAFRILKIQNVYKQNMHIIFMKIIYMCVCMCLCVCESLSRVQIFAGVRILEWVDILFSKGSSQPWDQVPVFHIAGRFFTVWPNRQLICTYVCIKMGFPGDSVGKESTWYTSHRGDMGLISVSRRFPGGHDNPLHCYWLKKPMGSRDWQAAVHGIAKSQTKLKQLSMHEHV